MLPVVGCRWPLMRPKSVDCREDKKHIHTCTHTQRDTARTAARDILFRMLRTGAWPSLRHAQRTLPIPLGPTIANLLSRSRPKSRFRNSVGPPARWTDNTYSIHRKTVHVCERKGVTLGHATRQGTHLHQVPGCDIVQVGQHVQTACACSTHIPGKQCQARPTHAICSV